MIEEIVSMALENGIWAALFCFLFLYMLKDSRNRESKYTATIDALGEQLTNLTAALKICDEIKTDCADNASSAREIMGSTKLIKDGVEAIKASLDI